MFSQAKKRLLQAYDRVQRKLDGAELDSYGHEFRNAYGPDVLDGLRGRDLLQLWHGPQNGSGLVYDLEFNAKYRDFGAIAGGSALKFKIYRGSDGEWKTRGHGNSPASCSEEEAIRLTELLADDLLEGCHWIRDFGLHGGSEEAWQRFQEAVSASNSALHDEAFDSPTLTLNWGHKYLAILYPELFSFHHRTAHLSSHLVQLGVLPQNTRYGNDWQWRQLRLEDSDLVSCHPVLLMHAAYDEEIGFGFGAGYWRIGTDEGEDKQDCWPGMRDEGYVSIGWGELMDLGGRLEGHSGRAAVMRLKDILAGLYPDRSASAIGKWAGQIRQFYEVMKPGDRIAAMKGQQLLGVGEIESDYYYQPRGIQFHKRKVRWHWVAAEARQGGGKFGEPWKNFPGLLTTICDFREQWQHALYVEERFVHGDFAQPVGPVPDGDSKPRPPVGIPLSHPAATIREVLERKKQIILHGPPGTGKTYHARHAAREILAAEMAGGSPWANLSVEQRRQIDARIGFCTFHPAYSYEEFIEGYRPLMKPQGPTFELRDGLFLEACAHSKETDRPYIFIIDEINRANVAAVFGELLTLLEKDKRETLEVRLPLSRRPFTVPANLWIIGTMNTADRSIALLDVALRRRFGFMELLPDTRPLDVTVEGLHLGRLLNELNARVRRHVPRNARELQIGHAYFLQEGKAIDNRAALHAVFRDDVVPLLSEYCYEDYATLRAILGEAVIDAESQSVQDNVQRDPRAMLDALKMILAEVTPLSLDSEDAVGSDGQESPPEMGLADDLAAGDA